MAKRATNPEQRIMLTKAQSAGWRVKDTSDGWQVYSPDGQSIVTMHTTSSDNRAVANAKRDFARAGLDMDKPLPPKPQKPQPTLSNESIFNPIAKLEQAINTEPEFLTTPRLVVTGRPQPQYLPEQPLKPTGKVARRADAPQWEAPPAKRHGGGRKGPMDKWRDAMMSHPGEWLVFTETGNSQTAAYHKRQYGKLGFEFISRQVKAGEPTYKVWARYMGGKA